MFQIVQKILKYIVQIKWNFINSIINLSSNCSIITVAFILDLQAAQNCMGL